MAQCGVLHNLHQNIHEPAQLMMLNVFSVSTRTSTTDDVECFFSVLRDTVGKYFTLKCVYVLWDFEIYVIMVTNVYYGWMKVMHKSLKQLDPDIPFYYHTSAHNHFYEGSVPDFHTKPRKMDP